MNLDGWWRAALVSGVVAVATAAALVALLPGDGARPPFAGGPVTVDEAVSAPVAPLADSPLQLAGSGSNLPVTRALAAALTATDPSARVLVHDSIGSSGGVGAARDGAVHLGLVSRPLRAAEAALGLVAIPYARTEVVVAANVDVPDDSLEVAALRALYRGEPHPWSDGRPAVLLLREPGDSSHRALAGALAGFGDDVAAAHLAGQWRTLYTDQQMQAALAGSPGAVGLLDRGAIASGNLSLKVLRLRGLPEGVGPVFKELSFVSRGAPTGGAAALVGFATSEAGRALLVRSGYVPAGVP